MAAICILNIIFIFFGKTTHWPDELAVSIQVWRVCSLPEPKLRPPESVFKRDPCSVMKQLVLIHDSSKLGCCMEHTVSSSQCYSSGTCQFGVIVMTTALNLVIGIGISILIVWETDLISLLAGPSLVCTYGSDPKLNEALGRNPPTKQWKLTSTHIYGTFSRWQAHEIVFTRARNYR